MALNWHILFIRASDYCVFLRLDGSCNLHGEVHGCYHVNYRSTQGGAHQPPVMPITIILQI